MVNVILVDFRAVDTWGEMTVLGATALTIAALLLNRRPTPPQPSAVDMRSHSPTCARTSSTSGCSAVSSAC